MRAAEAKSTEDCPVKMKLVAPPLYVLTTNVSLGHLPIVTHRKPLPVTLSIRRSLLPKFVPSRISRSAECSALLTVMLCTFQTLEKAKGIEVLKEACQACAEEILRHKGRMIVKDEARVVRISPIFQRTTLLFYTDTNLALSFVIECNSMVTCDAVKYPRCGVIWP